jgi:hypothetical protein
VGGLVASQAVSLDCARPRSPARRERRTQTARTHQGTPSGTVVLILAASSALRSRRAPLGPATPGIECRERHGHHIGYRNRSMRKRTLDEKRTVAGCGPQHREGTTPIHSWHSSCTRRPHAKQ